MLFRSSHQVRYDTPMLARVSAQGAYMKAVVLKVVAEVVVEVVVEVAVAVVVEVVVSSPVYRVLIASFL